jgi:hypothetical protein
MLARVGQRFDGRRTGDLDVVRMRADEEIPLKRTSFGSGATCFRMERNITALATSVLGMNWNKKDVCNSISRACVAVRERAAYNEKQQISGRAIKSHRGGIHADSADSDGQAI